MKKRALLVVALILGLLLAYAFSAQSDGVFHLALDKSTPEADQVVSEAPDKIVLDFTERPELSVSRIVVKGAQDAVELGDIERSEEDETILMAAFEAPLADGAYTVSWVTSSADGHPVRGEFSFTVQTGR